MPLAVRIFATRGDPGTTISYLANNEKLHVNQRIVAGSIQYQGHLDKQLVRQVSADLRFNQQMTGKVMPKGHIYHVTLAASTDNGQLSDARWNDIANDFMTQMRFTGKDLSPVRWTAINHGHNETGNDHIHIVMSLVRQNGRQVSLHNDMVKASAVATRLEQKYALGVLQSRLALVGAGSIPYSGKESQRARDQDRPEPARVTLERDIRAMAAEARTEAGFVALVRSSGLLVAPYPRETGMVTGYSVALPVVEGAKPEWFAGGRLAKDLTLPQLRRRWPLNKAASQYAWRGKIDQEVEPESPVVTPEQAGAALDELGESLADTTPAGFAETSHDLAGLLAIASRELEETPGELAAASREVGAWAQPTVMPTGVPALSRAGARLFVLSLDPSGERGRSVMFRQFAETMLELYRLHQAQRLRVATRKQVTSVPDDANPAAEVYEDGTTLMATGSMLMMANKAKQERAVAEGATDAGENPEGSEDVLGRNRTPKAGDTDLIDRNFFTDARRMESARRASIREQGRQQRLGDPLTPVQIEKLEKLSEQVGLPLDRETLSAVRGQDAERLIESYESAAKDWGLPPIQTGQYEAVATKLVTNGGATTGAEADVFLAGLERRAELRQQAADLAAFEAEQAVAKAGEAPWVDPDVMDYDQEYEALGSVVEERETARRDIAAEHGLPQSWEPVVNEHGQINPATDPNAYIELAMTHRPAPWSLDSKDPRNWADAGDPATPKQQFRLAEAGFSAPEIASLHKGEASVVVGEYLGPDKALPPSPERARKAYNRVQSDAIAAASGIDGAVPVRTATAASEAATPAAAVVPKKTQKPPLRPQQ